MKWREIDGRLELHLRFYSQTQLASTLLEIAHLADKFDHHPDMDVRKAYELTLRLWTHDEGVLTAKDYQLAEVIEDVLAKG